MCTLRVVYCGDTWSGPRQFPVSYRSSIPPSMVVTKVHAQRLLSRAFLKSSLRSHPRARWEALSRIRIVVLFKTFPVCPALAQFSVPKATKATWKRYCMCSTKDSNFFRNGMISTAMGANKNNLSCVCRLLPKFHRVFHFQRRCCVATARIGAPAAFFPSKCSPVSAHRATRRMAARQKRTQTTTHYLDSSIGWFIVTVTARDKWWRKKH